jgi:D-serine deaminase-like pyridoxal phosphate-dependent protein
MATTDWFVLQNVDKLDSPSLVVYPHRVLENIRILKGFVPEVDRIRPHVKTNKSAEISAMLLEAGISKFKCATIAEAEMLADVGAPDILLAYQPVGPKAHRLATLIKKYPRSSFSCLTDDADTARHLAAVAHEQNCQIRVFIDLNVGMNRTGIHADHAFDLYKILSTLVGLQVRGLHAYDGHLRDTDFQVRSQKCDLAFQPVEELRQKITTMQRDITVIAGGTPTFPIHAKRKSVECSPGTFIYWDKGYQSILPEQPFLFAALVVTRVISKPSDTMVTIDLGHKSIASENPLNNRVHFLNAPDLNPIGHSEEHMVLQSEKPNTYKVGDVFYGVPFHICPTVALHDRVAVAEAETITGYWKTLARNRILSL